MKKRYWIEGSEIDGWIVTDGIWTSKVYTDRKEAEEHLQRALWGEGVNTI